MALEDRTLGRDDAQNRIGYDQRFFAAPEGMDGCFTAITRLTITVPEALSGQEHMQPEWATLRFFDPPPTGLIAANGSHFGSARAVASGPSTSPNYYRAQDVHCWGIGLLPLGWARLMDCDAAPLANGLFDIETHPAFAAFAPLAQKLRDTPHHDDEVQYAVICEHLQSLDRPDSDASAINAAHAALLDPATKNVGQFAERSGLSTRTLGRLCNRFFGFPPALLLRRQRLMRSLTQFIMTNGHRWSDTIDDSFVDQAHFVREFRAFMKVSPNQYLGQIGPILRAGIESRAQALGRPVQTMEPPA